MKSKVNIKPYCRFCRHFGEVDNYMADCAVHGFKRPVSNYCKSGFEVDVEKVNKQFQE